MSATDVVAVYGAVIGTLSLVTTGALKGVEVWRNRASVRVSYGFSSQAFDPERAATLNHLANFRVAATLAGRHPVRVDSAGIDLRPASRWPIQLPRKRLYWSVPVFDGIDGSPGPFPTTLDPNHPGVTAYERTARLRTTLSRKEHGLPFRVWVSTSEGRRYRRLARSTIAVLTKPPEEMTRAGVQGAQPPDGGVGVSPTSP